MLRKAKYREGLAERLGQIPARLSRPSGRAIWVHAVSVGEVLAAGRLVEELERALPAVQIYLSTTTRTGQALARERFGTGRVFYYPLDFAFSTQAWLRFLTPAAIVLVESEFWPRLLVEANARRIPVAVVNARISDRSWPRYQALALLWRPLLATIGLALAQSEQDASRLRCLGALGARATGNLKFDVRTALTGALTATLHARLPTGVPVIVCGSTLAGEEALLLDALPLADVITILAPRHPERFDEVARLLCSRSIPHQRRSQWTLTMASDERTSVPLAAGTVLLLDSIGELASMYSLATLAIVGGGFLHAGGHNPLEPAQFSVPVVMGARYDNFRAVVDALLSAHAVVLSDPASLRTTITGLLAEPDRLRAMGARSREVFLEQAGGTMRTVGALLVLLAAQPEKTEIRVNPGQSPSETQR